MPKNIVICCDGTGNEFNPQSNSNVVKLCSTLVVNQDQTLYYHPGVGTMGSPTAHGWWQKEWSRVIGLAFGGGFFEDVGRAYEYLMYNYNEYEANGKSEHDRVYLFGFSRGAYTTRALASLLKMFGLLHPGNEAQIPYVLRMFNRRHKRQDDIRGLLDEARQFKEVFSRPCFIHFAGLWDTVSSVGWITEPVRLPYTASNPIIANVRHAQSIDERRIFFRQNSFVPLIKGVKAGAAAPSPITQDFKQVWFAGVHSDVGGSYAPERSGLSQIALEWMLVEAQSRGLLLHPEKVRRVLSYSDPRYAPNPVADLNVSLRGAWWILEFLPHNSYNHKTQRNQWSIPLGSPRTLPDQLQIHQSVRIRWETRPDYRPRNLPDLPPKNTDEPWVKYGEKDVTGMRSVDDRAVS